MYNTKPIKKALEVSVSAQIPCQLTAKEAEELLEFFKALEIARIIKGDKDED